MVKLLEALLLPPASLIALAGLGLLLLRTRRRQLGVVCLITSQVLLFAVSTPLATAALFRPLDRYPPLDLATAPAGENQAIAVLSAGVRLQAREYGRDTAAAMALERLRYGAWLAEHLGHPVLLTGSTSPVLAATLEEDYDTTARWIEAESGNTYEHALRCADLLHDAGIERLYVVTHYWHMPRAMAAFNILEGVEVVPAPMGFGESSRDRWDPRWLLPGVGALCANALALHEWMGRLWYWLRYGV